MKNRLIKWIKILLAFGGLFIAYTLLDFSFNVPEPVSYQFKIPELIPDKPVILKQDNMMIIVARYSEHFLDSLKPSGRIARISASLREQPNLIDENGYFIVHGYGTHMGCPLEITQNALKESCSDASYSLTGKSNNSGLYDDLKKVDYRFSQNHTILTIN